jgi:hypothetical protein
LTVNVLPAIVAVPVRAAPRLAAINRLTVPEPLPALPLVTVIHGALEAAVHEQPPAVVTVTGSDPPSAATGDESGAIE